MLFILIFVAYQVFQCVIGTENVSQPQSTIWDQIYRELATDDEFEIEMTKITNHASSLREGNPYGSFVNYTAGFNGIVGRLCFDDDVCWGTKITLRSSVRYRAGMWYAIKSLKAIERHCPDLPAPRVYGYSIENNATLCYYFMDWMEGKSLKEILSVTRTKISETRREFNISIPETIASQLASFLYDLTTCPIPDEEISQLVYDPRRIQPKAVSVQKIDFSGAKEWARMALVFAIGLLNPEERMRNEDLAHFKWVDQVALFTWALSKFPETDNSPFVLDYWDWHPGNMIVDDQGRLSVIDWELVGARPFRLSALSLRERFYHLYFIDRNVSFTNFHVSPSEEFVRGLQAREKQRPRLDGANLTDYLELSDHENFFLYKIFEGASLAQLNFSFPKNVKNVISWSSEHQSDLVAEWEHFASEFYLQRGRPVPDWRAYVEIQESLGILGSVNTVKLSRDPSPRPERHTI